LHGPLVAVNNNSIDPGATPAPKGSLPAHCLSLGRGGARPGGCGERGILAYPPARRKGGRVERRDGHASNFHILVGRDSSFSLGTPKIFI